MSGFAIRDEMNGVAEAPGKTWFWELEAAVIDADRCIQCGVCVAVCPSDSIAVGEDDLPVLAKMCTGCSLCWDFCPRGGLRHEATFTLDAGDGSTQHGVAEPSNGAAKHDVAAPTNGAPQLDAGERTNGVAKRGGAESGDRAASDDGAWKITGAASDGKPPAVRERYSARARRRGAEVQDGGVVTAILTALLEAGEIDGALVARESETERWKGEPFVARTPEELRDCAGSFYNNAMALAQLDRKQLRRRGLPADPRLAVVGTPCEVEGIRAMQARPWSRGSHQVDAIVLTIALLCTKSFNYEKLMVDQIARAREIPLDRIGRVDVLRGKLIVQDERRETLLEEPIRDFHGAALKGCDECADFLGNAADLSVGSVGSPDGWSSLLVRSAHGQRALELARERLELAELERPEALDKLDKLDKRIALKALQRPFDPDAPLFIDYERHLADYRDSDRAPVAHDR